MLSLKQSLKFKDDPFGDAIATQLKHHELVHHDQRIVVGIEQRSAMFDVLCDQGAYGLNKDEGQCSNGREVLNSLKQTYVTVTQFVTHLHHYMLGTLECFYLEA